MYKVLLILSSTSGTASISNQLARYFLTEFANRNPISQTVTRDLGTEPLPQLSTRTVAGVYGSPVELAEFSAASLSDLLIEEVEAADLLVIASPMHNFGISCGLKAWFDYIMRPGRTFRYGPHGPEGMLVNKRALVIQTRGGAYSFGPTVLMDHQEPHLRTMLEFIGIKAATFVRAEDLALGAAANEASLERATEILSRHAATLAA